MNIKYILLFLSTSLIAQQANIPTITAQWPDSGIFFSLKSNRPEISTYFGLFDQEDFLKHQLPQDDIRFRNEYQRVSGATLDQELNSCWAELQSNTSPPHSFRVLKDEHYNYQQKTGTIILALKNYPFVVKLYSETPRSFVRIRDKDPKQIGMFLIGGGTHRYVTGFTRIKNAQAIKAACEKSEEFRDIDIPRKWFWQPTDNLWFNVQGKNFPDSDETLSVSMPSSYAVVTDYIEKGSSLDSAAALNIARFLSPRMDANPDNFMIEKYTGKTVITDTEHFASMIGIRSPIDQDAYTSYAHYWKFLINKGIQDIILFDHKKKKERILPI